MSLNLNKAEKAIGVTAVVVIAAFFAVFSHINKKSDVSVNIDSDSKINYNMARPEEAFSEYSIQGREIDRYYEGLPEESKKAISKKKNELIKKKQAEVKKQEAVKKKLEELKKKQQAQAKAKQSQRRQDQVAKKFNELQADKKRLTDTARTDSNKYDSVVSYSPNSGGQAQIVQEQTQKPKKSYTEWREQIFSNPTSENIAAFIAAYRKSEVSSTELQAMAQDLLEQEDAKLKGLGLMVLRSVPSLASLSQLVHVEATLPQAFQSYLEQSYVAYLYPQNLTYLNAALATRDRQLVLRVLTILDSNLSRLAQGDASAFADPRNRRGNGSSTNITMSSFLSLVPGLGTISSGQDPQLSEMAQRVASYIQSSNNIAQTASSEILE